jgi:hypothetical protein
MADIYVERKSRFIKEGSSWVGFQQSVFCYLHLENLSRRVPLYITTIAGPTIL